VAYRMAQLPVTFGDLEGPSLRLSETFLSHIPLKIQQSINQSINQYFIYQLNRT